MNDITELLGRINNLDASLLAKIKSIDLLREAIHELNDMVEMNEAKRAVILQLKYILVKVLESDLSSDKQLLEQLFDDQMLHTVICGPPGTGKSQLGKILAKFYSSLGILKPAPVKKYSDNPEINAALTVAALKYTTSIELTNMQLNSSLENLNGIHWQIYNETQKKQPQQIFVDLNRRVGDLYNEIKSIINSNTYTVPIGPPADKIPFKVVSRVDFVAGYIGQSAIKTMKLLEESVGKVLFIDEAYTLILDDRDPFGMEVLTTLNLFMSDRPHDVIIIFGGYKDLMEKTIFKLQPGLRRRCSWLFEIKEYSPDGMGLIFTRQLKKYGWAVHESVELKKFFTDNKKEFPNYGGDSHKLAFYCKLYYHEEEFITLNGSNKRKRNPGPNIITEATLTRALKALQQNRMQEKEAPPPYGMYG